MIHEALRWRVVYLVYTYNVHPRDVAVILAVSERSVYRIMKLFNETGDVVSTRRSTTRGIVEYRPRWPTGAVQHLDRLIEDDPTFILEELCMEMRKEFPGIQVSPPTICRVLRHTLKITHKVMCKRARQASLRDVQDYALKLNCWYWNPSQVVFLDETSKDGRAAFRRYGWSKRGTPAVNVVPFEHGKRLSGLAALDYTGFIGWCYTACTFDQEAFYKGFCKNILPLLNRYPAPRSIVIMDNAKIHMFPEIGVAIQRRGALLVYLPAYAPWLNPIEQAFALVKRWLQRYCHRAWNLMPELCLDLAFLRALHDNNHSARSLGHCGYKDKRFEVPPWDA